MRIRAELERNGFLAKGNKRRATEEVEAQVEAKATVEVKAAEDKEAVKNGKRIAKEKAGVVVLIGEIEEIRVG